MPDLIPTDGLPCPRGPVRICRVEEVRRQPLWRRSLRHSAHKDTTSPTVAQSVRPGSRCRILRIRGRTRVTLERKSSAMISSTTPSQQQASWR